MYYFVVEDIYPTNKVCIGKIQQKILHYFTYMSNFICIFAL